MPRVRILCQSCRQPLDVEWIAGDTCLCPLCGAVTLIIPLAVEAPPPNPKMARHRTSMRVCTLLWILSMMAAFLIVGTDHDGHKNPSADLVAIILSSLCFWFFETLLYGVVMILLWVFREDAE